MPYNVLPVLTTLLGAHHHIDEATVGYLISVNTFAGLIASAAGPFWIARVRYRPAMGACFVLYATCLAASAQVTGMPALLLLQVILGASGLVIASISQTIFAQLPRPERALGIKTSTDMIFAALFLAMVPVAHIGLPGFVGLLAMLLAASAAASRLLPRALHDGDSPRRDAQPADPGGPGHAPLAVWIVLAAMVSLSVGVLGMWTFVGHFGTAAGLDADGVAKTVAMGLVGGIAGALGAAAHAGRGSIAPEVVAGIGCVLSMPAMALARNAAEFTAANVAFNVGGSFFAPFLAGIVARRDPTQRLNTLVPAAMMIGGILGPPLAGTLLQKTSTLTAALSLMAIALPSVGVYATVTRVGNGRRESTPS